MLDASIFTVPAERIDRDLVMSFLAQHAVERLFTESTTVEFKRENSNAGVVKAICGMANTDGGIVFVGVNEQTPDRAPGVSPAEHDKLMNQCREIVQPVFYPEVVPVPADEPGKAILVVRVDALPLLQPVLCQGTVFVRVPGSTVKANRDQVIALVGRHASAGMTAPGAGGLTLISSYHPPTPTGASDDPPLPNLRLRGAGAVALRAETRGRHILSTAVRQTIQTMVDSSDVVGWASGQAPMSPISRSGSQSTSWGVEIARADTWRQRRRLPRRWNPRDVWVAVEARVRGAQLSWAVDIDIFDSDAGQPDRQAHHGTILSADHVLRGWRELARLVGIEIPGALADQLASPPLAPPEAALWAEPAQQDLRSALGLDALAREGEARPPSHAQLPLDSGELHDLEATLLSWLTHALLDDGVRDAESVAADLVRQAMARPVDASWV